MMEYEPLHDEIAFSHTLYRPTRNKTLRKKLKELLNEKIPGHSINERYSPLKYEDRY